MAELFDTLGADQERLLAQISSQMRVGAELEQPVSSPSVIAAVGRVYHSVGLRTPQVVWADGPFQLSVMPLLLQLLAFRSGDKKSDDLNIDSRIEELGRLLARTEWQAAFCRLTEQISATHICSLKYDEEPVLPDLAEMYVRFKWSSCGVSAALPILSLLQSNRSEAIACLADSATLGLAAKLTSHLYTRPIDAVQHIKRTVGHVLLAEQSLSLRDAPTTIFGSSRGSMTALYRRALDLHEQIGGSKFERELAQCRAPQADEKYRKPRQLQPNNAMNTAALLAFGPYDTLWGAWASYSATCYAVIADMLRDQFTREVRSTLSDLSLLMRCGFAYSPLTRVLFICSLPRVRVDDLRRLHSQDRAAVEFPDGYKIFAWRGTVVPREIIENPECLTATRIDIEQNVEMRRALIDKFGVAAYLRETCAGIMDQNEMGTLYLKQLPGDEPIALVRVKNSTPEPDGSFKEYFLRVPPHMKTVQEAVAWTFRMNAEEYKPSLET